MGARTKYINGLGIVNQEASSSPSLLGYPSYFLLYPSMVIVSVKGGGPA